MTLVETTEDDIKRILDRGTFGWLPPYFKWVTDMDEDEELQRFSQFRERCRVRLPWKIDNWDDLFPYDQEEAEKMLADLASRKRQPLQGLWFDNLVCQMCGLDTPDLVQDHCHFTGLNRGLLCRRCNQREGLDDDPKWRLWRLAAPELERPNRSIYRYECKDCDHKTLMKCPFPVLYDFHRWVSAENYHMLKSLARRSLRKAVS